MIPSEWASQTVDDFKDWYFEVYGVEFQEVRKTEMVKPLTISLIPDSVPEMVHRAAKSMSGAPNDRQQEIINKLAGILVDMVIDERARK